MKSIKDHRHIYNSAPWEDGGAMNSFGRQPQEGILLVCRPAKTMSCQEAQAPEPCTAPGRAGRVRRHDVLGGIIDEYERAA